MKFAASLCVLPRFCGERQLAAARPSPEAGQCAVHIVVPLIRGRPPARCPRRARRTRGPGGQVRSRPARSDADRIVDHLRLLVGRDVSGREGDGDHREQREQDSRQPDGTGVASRVLHGGIIGQAQAAGAGSRTGRWITRFLRRRRAHRCAAGRGRRSLASGRAPPLGAVLSRIRPRHAAGRRDVGLDRVAPCPDEIRGSLGRNDSEAAYRYYLAMSRLGTPREARAIFSVPGVEVREP